MAARTPNRWKPRNAIPTCLLCAALLCAAAPCASPAWADTPHKYSKAVQEKIEAGGADSIALIVMYGSPPGPMQRKRVGDLGGSVKTQFRSINGLAVDLPASAVDTLSLDADVEWISEDAIVRAAMDLALPIATMPAANSPDAPYTGAGVAVAVLDSGIDDHLDTNSRVVYRVATASMRMPSEDLWGHGTHVAGIIAGDGAESGGLYRGVAPGATMVAVRMLDDTGEGYTAAVIGGLDFVLDYKDVFNIRVVNLSLGKAIQEDAAHDPLVQAVEKVWDAGIVVVCSAGNFGREGYFTITSPGNSRKVITVGALTDWNTPETADDSVASYSSRGPTLLDHFAKPDLIAPGNRLVAQRARYSTLDGLYPDWRVDGDGDGIAEYLEMSGTSMAAGVVSGAVALMLEKDPTLDPSSVKARLMRSARSIPGADPMMQGAGLIDIAAALQETGRTDTAWSPIVFREEVEGLVSTEETALLWGSEQWSLAVLWTDAVLWADAVLWGDAILWSDAVLWGDAILWSDAVMWSDVILWSDTVLWSDVVLWADSVLWSDTVPVGD